MFVTPAAAAAATLCMGEINATIVNKIETKIHHSNFSEDFLLFCRIPDSVFCNKKLQFIY